MINMDGELHLALRREHSPFFTPARLAELERKVRAEVTHLLDAIAPLSCCDLVETVSARLPLFTTCELLGVPEADRPKFLGWMHYLELAGNLAADRHKLTGPPSPELLRFIDDFGGQMDELFEYGRAILHERRKEPRDDLLSAIARIEVEGDPLRDEYLDGSWLLIVFAGNDTTRNTISAAIKLLTEWPEEKQKLIGRPELLPNAVHELTRMISPAVYMRRTAMRETELPDKGSRKARRPSCFTAPLTATERCSPIRTGSMLRARTRTSISPSALAAISASASGLARCSSRRSMPRSCAAFPTWNMRAASRSDPATSSCPIASFRSRSARSANRCRQARS